MANKKFEKHIQKTKWQDYFKPTHYKEWRIDLNKNTGRIELQKDGKVMFSIMSVDACKNYAFLNYGVPIEKWN